MSIFKPKLTGKFKIKGVWWLPKTPEHKVAGTLSFNGSRTIQLEIQGSIYGSDLWVQHRSTPAIILGLSEKGDELTLFENVEFHKSGNVRGGTGKTKYQSFYFFWGAHFQSPSEINFDVCTVNYSFLEEWIGKSPFSDEFLKKEGKFVGRSVTYDLDRSLEIEVPSIGSILRIWHGLSTGRRGNSYRKLVWEHAANIDIDSRELRDFRWHRSNVYKLRNLFTLLVGTPVHMKDVKLWVKAKNEGDNSDGPRVPEKFTYVYFNQEFEATERDLHPGDLLVPMRDLDDKDIARMFEKWFATSDQFETVHQLYFGTLKKKGLVDHVRFLSLMQALETYHRISEKGQYLSENRYSQILASIIPAIPPGTPDDLKQSLKSRIKFGNEYSLRKRIKSLLEGLSDECGKLITDDADHFISKIVDTRNYLTHYSEELKSGALESAELHNSALRIKILLIILFLKEVGLEENRIAALLKKNGELMNSWVVNIEFKS